MKLIGIAWKILLVAVVAFAHQQPTTLVLLELAPGAVTMQLHLPLSELELAFGHAVGLRPELVTGAARADLEKYLVQHVRVVTPEGAAWTVQVQDVLVQKAEQTQSGVFQEALVRLTMRAPQGASARRFTLFYDVILHQVVTHRALVSVHRDWEGGLAGGGAREVGVLRVDLASSRIEPLVLDLGEGGWGKGFWGMVVLGMQHIREGADHLLFLLMLLLPALLLVEGKRWGGFGGAQRSLWRLLQVVSSFTAGHSITLLAAAVGWLRPPQQPVEVLIAVSVLVSAIHAIRPLFPGRENYVAAGFGLVHGLAFASGLAELKLSVGPMALSIFGFNLGIELMQIFAIVLTVPWLILLSFTPFHAWIRTLLAWAAAVAALGWIVNRVSGAENAVARGMDAVTNLAPLGVVLLALAAMAAYLYENVIKKTYFAGTERVS